MGSASGVLRETVDYLNAKGEKVGFIDAHLYRPFSAKYFLSQLPEKFPEDDPNLKYAYAFILNGCVGLIRTWLTEPEQKSAEHMAELTYKMIESTTQGYLEMLKK